MKTRKSIPLCNIMRSPGRTIALGCLSVLLSFSILGGSLAVLGLRSGLSSLEERLGADIMVVPYEATTKSSFSNLILQGSPGYFYMDSSILDEVKEIEGVGDASEQFFLASASAGCCSVAVQIIGFNPDTDFTIQPWISGKYTDKLGYMDIVAGHSLNVSVGDTLTFYGSTCRVSAKMDETGTYLDASVYGDEDTIKTLIASALEKQIYDFGDVDPDRVVSSVLVNVADGYSVEDVAGQINLYCDGVSAVQTQSLVSEVSSGIGSVSGVIGALIAVIWALALLIQILAFAMISNERKKEFAVIRLLGASRRRLAGIVLKEGMIISLVGALAGGGISALALCLFSGWIESSLGLPFLLPRGGMMAALFVCAIALSVLTGAVASGVSAMRVSRADTAFILREK